MKILNVIATIDPKGGGPIEWVRRFAHAGSALGHSIDVATLDPPDAEVIGNYTGGVFAFGSSLNGFYARGLVPWLRCNASSYDAVFAHGLWRYPSLATWRGLRSSSVPYFIYTHGMLSPWFKQHHPFKHAAKRLYWPWTEYPALRDAQAVFFTCEEERRQARESFRLYSANEIVAPLGQSAPPAHLASLRESFLNTYSLHDKRVVLFLGRLVPIKGGDLLLRAFKAIAPIDPSLRLVFAGPDTVGWKSYLIREAEALGIDRQVVWTGMLDADLRWGALAAAEVFVLPSHHENYSFTTVEALACGVPPVISNKVGIWQDVHSAHGGLVCDDNTAGTTAALRAWMMLSYADREAMSRRARLCFAERFELNRAVRNLLAVVSEYTCHAAVNINAT